MRTKPTKIKCSTCGKANLVRKVIEHDVGPLLDMRKVVVHGLPALVCPKCGSVTLFGSTLDQIAILLAVDILQRPELHPEEVRYLRKLVGDTQDEFAQRLGVVRATVNRWENGGDHVKGPDAYAIRSHTFFRLRDTSEEIEAVAGAFTSDKPPRRPRKKSYSIEGALLQAAR